jgi:hypothetical protein
MIELLVDNRSVIATVVFDQWLNWHTVMYRVQIITYNVGLAFHNHFSLSPSFIKNSNN